MLGFLTVGDIKNYVKLNINTCVHMSSGILGGQKRVSDSPRAGIIASCELPGTGAGNQTWVPCVLSTAAPSLKPSPSSLKC